MARQTGIWVFTVNGYLAEDAGKFGGVVHT